MSPAATAQRLTLAEGLLLTLRGAGASITAVQNARALLDHGSPGRGMVLSLGSSPRASKRDVVEARRLLEAEVRRLRPLAEAQFSHYDGKDGAFHTVICDGCKKSGGLSAPAKSRVDGYEVASFKCQCGATTIVKNKLGSKERIAGGASKENNPRPKLKLREAAAPAKGRGGTRAAQSTDPNSADFEKKHKRVVRGRVGGGQFARKGDGLGANGPDRRVDQLQERLAQLGFTVERDGKFGDQTEAAVKAFQTKYGLKPTGQVDEATLVVLRNPPERSVADTQAQNRADAELGNSQGDRPDSSSGSSSSSDGDRADSDEEGADGSSSDSSDLGDDSLHKGRGMGDEPDESTRALQQILDALGYDLGDAGVDGRFGPDTEKVVKKLQRRYGLKADGIVGRQTKALLRRIARRHARRLRNLDVMAIVSEARLVEAPTDYVYPYTAEPGHNVTEKLPRQPDLRIKDRRDDPEDDETLAQRLRIRLAEAMTARKAATDATTFTRARAIEAVWRGRLDAVLQRQQAARAERHAVEQARERLAEGADLNRYRQLYSK